MTSKRWEGGSKRILPLVLLLPSRLLPDLVVDWTVPRSGLGPGPTLPCNGRGVPGIHLSVDLTALCVRRQT